MRNQRTESHFCRLFLVNINNYRKVGCFGESKITDRQSAGLLDTQRNPIAALKLSIILVSSLCPFVDNLSNGSPIVFKI